MSTDIREKMLRTKALQEMKINAEITDIRCNIDYLFEWNGEATHLFATMNGSEYTSMYGDWFITKQKAKKYFNNEIDDETIIKQKHINQNEFNKVRKYKNIKSNVYLIATIYYEISYIDGKSEWASEEIKIKNNNAHSKLLRYINLKSSQIYADVTKEDIRIKFDENKMILNSADESSINTMDNIEEFIINYLSKSNNWVDCKIEEIETEDNSIFIPVYIDDKCVKFMFSNPEDSKSSVWNFAKQFGYEDPWNLQNEDAQISLNMNGIKSYYEKEFWNIRKPINKSNTIKSKIMNIFP